MDRVFILDLNNDLLSLQNLVSGLDNDSEIVKRISELLYKLRQKCEQSVETRAKSNVDLFNEIKTSTKKFESLNTSFMLSAKPTLYSNKNLLNELISEICKNSMQAGADQIRFEIRDYSIIIRDNGKCTQEIVNRLRYEFNAGSRIVGTGKGSQSLYLFCKEHHIKAEFYLCPSIDCKFKKTSLAIKLLLKE